MNKEYLIYKLADKVKSTSRIDSALFQRYGVNLPSYAIFCTLKHYTEECHIPLKQNPSVLKPPRLEEVCNHFGLTQDFIAGKCQKWYGGGDHYHDARFDAAASYLCMVVGERMG